jgi:hypothetical protein
MENLSIEISAADVSMLRRIAKTQHRRFDDMLQLVFASGLDSYFCEENVYVDKLQEEYTEDELKQNELNDKIKTDIQTGWEDMKAAGYVTVDKYFSNSHYSADDDDLIRPIADRIRSICLD